MPPESTPAEMVLVRGGRVSASGSRPPSSCPISGSTSTRSPTPASNASSTPGAIEIRSTGRSRSAQAIACSASTKPWHVSAIQPAERARPAGSLARFRKARRTFPSPASAGSKRRRTRSSPARACRRSITGIDRQAPTRLFSDVLRLSNFDGKGRGPRPASAAASGPWGTVDMGGNVKEWCANTVEGKDLRYILGGGWNEPVYRFRDSEARDPWDRQLVHGVRLVKNLGAVGDAYAAVAGVYGDPKSPRAGGRPGIRRPEALLRLRTIAAQRPDRGRRRQLAVLEKRDRQLRRRVWRGTRAGLPVPAEERPTAVPDDRPLPERATRARRDRASSSTTAHSSSSFAADGPSCIPVYKGTFERGGGRPAARGRARHARSVGEGFLPRRRLPRDPPGNRQGQAGVLQPQHGRVLRARFRSPSSRASRSRCSRPGGLRSTRRRRRSRPTSCRA